MANPETGPLSKKLPELHKEKEIETAAIRHTQRTGDKLPNNPEAKIGAYLNRLEKIFLEPEEEDRQKNVRRIRPALHEALIIKTENVPESYFELQQRIARERGQPVDEIPQDVREKMIAVVIEDQKESLDNWTEYLTSEDAMYPTWFKYLAFRSISKLSQFDKERGVFKKRNKHTTAPFPDIYREALALVADKLAASAGGNTERFQNNEELKAYAEKNFPDLYAREIQTVLEATVEGRETVEGEWIKYNQEKRDYEEPDEYWDEEEQEWRERPHAEQDSEKERGEADRLYESLQGKGTGWCTAGRSTAHHQLQQGDFYVYYTLDDAGKPTQPRIAIRMAGDEIAEIRGVLPHQEVEPNIQEILDEKLETFGSRADKFKKKSADMKRLTVIEKSIGENKELDEGDLKFLYEIDSKIEGFGYGKDPRIEELLTIRKDGQRNKEDVQRLWPTLTPIERTKLLIREQGAYLPYLASLPDFDDVGFVNNLLEENATRQVLDDEYEETSHRFNPVDFIIANIQYFKNIDGSSVAAKLLTKVHGHHKDSVKSLFSSFNKFPNFDSNRLITEYIGPVEPARLKNFNEEYHRTLYQIINSHESFNAETAKLFIEKGLALDVAQFIEKFPDADPNTLLPRLAKPEPGDSYQPEAFIKALTKFTEIDSTHYFLAYMDFAQSHKISLSYLLEGIKDIERIDRTQVVQKLFELNEWQAVEITIKHLDSLGDIDYTATALRILDTSQSVSYYLKKFLEKATQIGRMDSIDSTLIANFILDKKSRHVSFYDLLERDGLMNYFQNLDSGVAQRILEEGPRYNHSDSYLARFLLDRKEKFGNLSPEFIEKLEQAATT